MPTEKEIQGIVFKYLPPDRFRIFLFGSRATGKASRWSDYDVGVLGQEKIPLATLAQIEEELENSSLPYRVEVVDFKRVTDRFARVALQRTKVWSTPN